ncbi:MAG: hypothetical protein KAG61_08090 [Bacteriovoracaceae bacterium]|nr:hypothetical protein [Bacteriovoracaceae bacterium]
MKKLSSLSLAALFVAAALFTACSHNGRTVASEKQKVEYMKHSDQEWRSYFGDVPRDEETHKAYYK